ncbi:MAG: hypothetical protein OHK93_007396 [Ramalina farinacea]|uniref:FAD-binding domain-containing protein n=1 Tax=Ramalina farinacea TaxID=258253 RepID=A0AA43QLL9_9LECA|nr:hypothetical protein [Ramalina farinacea]
MDQVDVLICGGGPVGLLTAHCLARYGLSTYVIEQHERLKQTLYGRAAMIAPRSLEMLEQLGLADGLMQMGFVVRGQITYRDGQRVEDEQLGSVDASETFFDYLLLLRQKYTEDIIGAAYKKCSGRSIHYGTKLHGYRLIKDASDNEVEATISAGSEPDTRTIQCKYLVGADGGRSTVRSLAGIPFEGDISNRQFIRIDGIVETDMPDARETNIIIQSHSHGNVLWACLDQGVTRIGFSFPEHLYKTLGAKISKEDVIHEAKKALEPFTLSFSRIDWWTAYSVGQRLAADFRAHDSVFIAGDAAHTHSSAGAQGLNIGIHDAVNLSWKLAGHVKGWYADSVIQSYTKERRPAAAAVIEQDKLLSVLYAGELPEKYKNDRNADRNKILASLMKQGSRNITGIAIAYAAENPTLVEFSNKTVPAGGRAPDALVQRPGIRVPIRLLTLFGNVGKFTILTFSGDLPKTSRAVKSWREYVDKHDNPSLLRAEVFQHLTIMYVENRRASPEELLGVPPFGFTSYDVDGSAHDRYGVPQDEGGVFVLRPDGTIGTACKLDEGLKVSDYFRGFLKEQVQAANGTDRDKSASGTSTPTQVVAEIELDKA